MDCTFVVNYYGLPSTDVKGLPSENFNIKTKRPLEISNEKGYFMSSNFRTDPSGQLTVSDKMIKPPKTFEMTKVPLKQPNK